MTPSIGLFDSGVGGLTVAAAVRAQLPGVRLHYVADSACAPYGDKGAAFIRTRSLQIGQHLREQGAAMLVVACNTATAHAAEALRAAHPDLPVVGIEPGVKPAVARSRNGRVGVLATAATVNSERFKTLVARHAGAASVSAVACHGVVEHIEAGDLQSPALRALVTRHCAPLRQAGVDTVLLGCTHFPFIRALWQEALGPQVQVLQVEEAVASQAARLWRHGRSDGTIRLSSTGQLHRLAWLAHEGLGWSAFALQRAVVPLTEVALVPGTGLEPVRPFSGTGGV